MGIAGKLMKRSAGAGPLALGFSSDIITLYALERDDAWEEVGNADIASPDFAEQIEALRVEAMVRDKSQAPITIWLPADQVIERHYTLAATSDDARRAEAARRIADETPHGSHELSVAIASDSRFEPVKVLAVLLQTMIEARSYAAGWGFTPGLISTRVGLRSFSAPGPIFEFPRSVASRAGRTATRLAVAAMALAMVGGAAFGGYHLVRPMLESPVAVTSSGPAPASFAVFLDPAPGRQAPMKAVEKTTANGLSLPRMRADAETFAVAAGTDGYSGAPSFAIPRGLDAPTGSDPLKVGAAPDKPRREGALDIEQRDGSTPKIILAAVDPVKPIPESVDSAPDIRPDTEAENTSPTADEPIGETPAEAANNETPVATEVEDATEFAPKTMAFAPPARPGDPETEGSTTAALSVPAPRPDTLVELTPGAPGTPEARRKPANNTVETPTPDEPAETAAVTEAEPKPTPEVAPVKPETPAADPDEATETRTTALAPPDPRPRDLATRAGIAETVLREEKTPKVEVESEDKPSAGIAATAIAPTARPERLTRSTPAPNNDPKPDLAEPTRLALAPATNKIERPTIDDSTEAPNIKAPEPTKRPRALEFAARRMPARTRTPLSVYLPRSVGDAARRTGLALNKTNLIGVIEAKNGRQALVRLPNGGYRKVGRGDNLDGWRVSAVNRESLRLTRRGEKRTLLLVNP